MKTWEKLALGALLLGGTCVGCASHLVPMTPRPDTRMIWGVHLDSLAITGTLQLLQAGLPNEAAICYHGEVRDTLFQSPDGAEMVAQIILIHSVTPAVQDSADNFHVYFTGRHAGCSDEIAVGHSHPYASHCDSSDDDSRLLFGDPKALVSLVWCMNGELQVMYQDGRRGLHVWRL